MHVNLLNIEINDRIINKRIRLQKLNVSLTNRNGIWIPFWIDNIFKRLIKTAMPICRKVVISTWTFGALKKLKKKKNRRENQSFCTLTLGNNYLELTSDSVRVRHFHLFPSQYYKKRTNHHHQALTD